MRTSMRTSMKRGKLINVIGDATDPQRRRHDEIVVIPHCCNNENLWGAGFVLALNERWKEPEQVYRNFCEKNKNVPILGKVCYAKISDKFIVANMIGQDGTVSRDNPKPVKYRHLANCMVEVVGYIEMIKTQTSGPVVIHTPMFGSGLAQGNFDFILELMREIWTDNGIDVVVYKF
jgi:hypothetical protein